MNGSGEESVDGRDAGRMEDEPATRLFCEGGVCSSALRMGRNANKSLVCADAVHVCTVTSSSTTKDD